MGKKNKKKIFQMISEFLFDLLIPDKQPQLIYSFIFSKCGFVRSLKLNYILIDTEIKNCLPLESVARPQH